MKRTICVIVSTTGELSIEAINFKGADCDQATRFLEKALGLTSTKQRKREYNERNRAKRQQRIGE